MDESAYEAPADRSSGRSDPLGDLVQALLDNPWLKEALHVAFEARERASVAGTQAIRGLNLPTAADTDRLERRLRAVSERLDSVEDALDGLTRELAELRSRAPRQ